MEDVRVVFLKFCSPSPPTTLVFMFLAELETLLLPGEQEEEISKTRGLRIFYCFLSVNILMIKHSWILYA